MVEFEADDALATAASRWRDSGTVDQVIICSPDKDLTQVVKADKVVCRDRRRKTTFAEVDVVEKFGVAPASIQDYLALVGDPADGIPGIPRWGAKSTATIIKHYQHIEDIPQDPKFWAVKVRGAASMARSLAVNMEEALLYKELATLRTDVPLKESLADLEWKGVPPREFKTLCTSLGFYRLMNLPHKWAKY